MNAATVNPSRSLPPAYFSQQVVNARRFYLNLDPPRTAALAVVSGGCEFCSPDYRVRRSTFPFYSIEYVLRGRGRLKLDGRARELQPGSIFSYGPGIPHDIIADPSDPQVKYFIDFSGRQSKGLLQRSRLPPGSVLQVFPPYEIQNLFDELIHCGQQNPRPESPLCRGLLECI
ncbi:MAG TPA: AraC family ligand binding domain-containing protein, partial [Verrucomicrobiae bacterium]|nr:AraC family ligand binding domain-containing protein [Verrucomicrobiae bacterium]